MIHNAAKHEQRPDLVTVFSLHQQQLERAAAAVARNPSMGAVHRTRVAARRLRALLRSLGEGENHIEVRRYRSCEALHVIADIEPEPPESRVREGAARLDGLAPDLIVAVGGGSVIDAAKAMRLLHEHPELTLRELTRPLPLLRG